MERVLTLDTKLKEVLRVKGFHVHLLKQLLKASLVGSLGRPSVTGLMSKCVRSEETRPALWLNNMPLM